MDKNSEKMPRQSEERGKYSITGYLVLLFAVVIVLVLLSYFVNQNDSDQWKNDFSQAHNDKVALLEQRVQALEERVSQLELTLDKFEGKEE